MTTCVKCKHWKEWNLKDYPVIGPNVLRLGNCYNSSFAKIFGKQTTGTTQTCESFEPKEGSE